MKNEQSNNNEWVIHVWGKKRDELALTDVERFHIDMLSKYKSQQKRFRKILVNIAMDDDTDLKLFEFLKNKIKLGLFYDNVEFHMCKNEKDLCEYVTYKPYVFDRLGEDVNILYTHFKGYHSWLQTEGAAYPDRFAQVNEMFWSYIMYERCLANMDTVETALKDKCAYGWAKAYVEREEAEKNSVLYEIKYDRSIAETKEDFFKHVKTFGLHCPGTFAWINMKNIANVIGDDIDYVKDTSFVQAYHEKHPETEIATHFSELYLMQFLNPDDLVSVDDFGDYLRRVIYIDIYAEKKLAKDLHDSFDKYIIRNKFI